MNDEACELVGGQGYRFPTPLVPIQLEACGPKIWCKLEFMNPSGSTKDRIANFIIGKAFRRGEIQRGSLVVEASSGSTSIAMACSCAQFGLKFIAVMPEGVSNERTQIIRAYGGEVVFSSRADGIVGAITRAREIAAEKQGFLPKQFENADNPAAHRHQTAQEIISQLPNQRIDAVVSGVGTGGTLVGLFQGFSDYGFRLKPFAARPVTGKNFGDAECCMFSARIPGVIDGLSEIYNEAALPGLEELEVDDDLGQAPDKNGFPCRTELWLELSSVFAGS
jgi:cysteine synthase A